MGLMEVRKKLEEIERQPAIYGRWIVVAGLSRWAAAV